MHIWMRLPPQPNIVPFDRFVVEEVCGRQRVVGVTSWVITGGTSDMMLEKQSDGRVFRIGISIV